MNHDADSPLVPVILSGGVGARLWPVSRESTPKPFMKVGGDTSLLRRTFDRGRALPGAAEVITVTNRGELSAPVASSTRERTLRDRSSSSPSAATRLPPSRSRP